MAGHHYILEIFPSLLGIKFNFLPIFAPAKYPQTMESLKELYKIGNGPSSSHTMGPKLAAEQFLQRCPDAESFKVTLYGSLAATGRGHLTDKAIESVLQPIAPTEIVWQPNIFLPFHPNGMRFEALRGGKTYDEWEIYSVGGGALANEQTKPANKKQIYPLNTISETVSSRLTLRISRNFCRSFSPIAIPIRAEVAVRIP